MLRREVVLIISPRSGNLPRVPDLLFPPAFNPAVLNDYLEGEKLNLSTSSQNGQCL